MQYLENDMDDLFQRAAENYALKNTEGDWESIAGRINPSVGKTKAIQFERKKSYKKLVSLLILSVALSAGGFLSQQSTNKSAVSIPELIRQKGNLMNKLTNKTEAGIQHTVKQIITTKGQNKTIVTYRKPPIIYFENIFTNKTVRLNQTFLYPEDELKKANKNELDNVHGAEGVALVKIIGAAPYTIKEDSQNLPIDNRRKEIEKNSITIKPVITPLKISLLKDTNILNYTKHISSTIPQQKKKFYIGFAGGPDFSKVQSTPFNNLGFDIGLVAGISVNNKISFETGIIWNKKNYRSEGAKFSIDKIKSTMPAGMIINNLESESSLIEIPLNIQYNFILKKKSGLFISTGISAYIMTKEKNMYNVTMNGTAEKITGMYVKNNYGLPAVVNISAGYTQKISKYLELRIAPFLKIPLQGMGVGSLPITSTGLHVGIIHQFK